MAGDASPGGVAVIEDTLEANGGTIRSAAGADAALGHAGLAPDAAHKVDGAAPGFASAEVDGTALTVTFDEALDAGSPPAGSDFTVTAAPGEGEARSVAGTGTAGIEEAAVTVTLADPVLVGETVTVAYTPPSGAEASPLRDAAGNEVAAFAEESAANATADTAGPVLVSATVSGTALTLTFDGTLSYEGEHWPALAAWAVSVNGAGRAVASGVLRGNRSDVALTLASAVVPGDAVTVGYGGTRLRDIEGRAVAPFSGARVNNPPKLAGSAVVGAALTLTFDVALDSGSVPEAGAFAVTADGAAAELAGSEAVALSGAAVTLALAEAVAPDAAVTVSYVLPAAEGAARLRDAAGNEAEAFSGEAVANGTAPPAVVSAGVVSDPGADGAYTKGETVEAAVTFDRAVAVDTEGGTPTLALIVDGTIRRAPYASGSGTERLVFAYRAVEAGRDVQRGAGGGLGAQAQRRRHRGRGGRHAGGARVRRGAGGDGGDHRQRAGRALGGGRRGRGGAALRRAGRGRGRAFGPVRAGECGQDGGVRRRLGDGCAHLPLRARRGRRAV